MNSITKSIGAFDAKTHLSQYLDEVQKGETIQITRRGKPVAVLVPAETSLSSESEVDQVIHRVRERSAAYGISNEEISQWKKEGRR